MSDLLVPVARAGRSRFQRGWIPLAVVAAFAPARAAPASRDAFVARHRCAVVGQLEAIHRRGPVTTSRDRFIVVSLRDLPQGYAQCIFEDRDTALFCEASSGAYRDPSDTAPPLRLSPAAVAALHALGFRQEDPRENFSRTVRVGDPPDLGIAADVMLAALHDAYGARAGTAIEITAPRGGPDGVGCGAPTS